MEFDVAFYEVFEEEESLLREFLPEKYRYRFTEKSIQDTGQSEPPAAVISIRTQSVIPNLWLDRIDGLFTRSTGYDHLAEIITSQGDRLQTGHLPNYAARAVAEQALLMMLMLARKIDQQRDAVKQFYRNGLTGSEIRGKTLSVIGVGHIGSEVARIGAGLEMELLGVDLIEKEEISGEYGLRYVAFEEAIVNADFIVCALPLTKLTRKMLDYSALRNAKSRAFLINPARGEITPSEDLLRLLEEHRLAGVALDVYDNESVLGSYLRGEIDITDIESAEVQRSIQATLDLLRHPQVITTPHNAFNTRESTQQKTQQTAENIQHFLEDGIFRDPIHRGV